MPLLYRIDGDCTLCIFVHTRYTCPSMTWQLLAAISVLGLSVSVVLQRVLLHKNKADPYAYAVVFQGIVGVLLTVFVLFYGFSLPNIKNLIVPALISIVCYGVGHIIYAKTLQHVEASAFSVLFATQAIWMMILGVTLFHETLTVLQLLGSLLIFASVALLVQNIRALAVNKGVALGLLTGLLFGVAITAWSYVGRHTDALSWAAISFIGTSLASLCVKPSAVKAMKPLFRGRVLTTLGLLAIFYAIGSVAMLFAYKEGTFSIVSPLRQTGIIVTTLLALLLLPAERTHIARKMAAAAVCLAGVLLVVL